MLSKPFIYTQTCATLLILGVPSRLVQHVEREVLSWIKKKFRKTLNDTIAFEVLSDCV